MQWFDLEAFDILEICLLHECRGGRLREVVATGGSTVVQNPHEEEKERLPDLLTRTKRCPFSLARYRTIPGWKKVTKAIFILMNTRTRMFFLTPEIDSGILHPQLRIEESDWFLIRKIEEKN